MSGSQLDNSANGFPMAHPTSLRSQRAGRSFRVSRRSVLPCPVVSSVPVDPGLASSSADSDYRTVSSQTNEREDICRFTGWEPACASGLYGLPCVHLLPPGKLRNPGEALRPLGKPGCWLSLLNPRFGFPELARLMSSSSVLGHGWDWIPFLAPQEQPLACATVSRGAAATCFSGDG